MTPGPHPAGSRGRVLVVDDDEAMSETVADCLVRRGFTAASRTSAESALALLDTREFDVVFTDLNMAGMDGLALCRRLAEIRHDLPVVICSAFGSLEVRASAWAAGAFEFMAKPFELDELRSTLDRAVAYGRDAEARRVAAGEK